jgi:hypothetical protein
MRNCLLVQGENIYFYCCQIKWGKFPELESFFPIVEMECVLELLGKRSSLILNRITCIFIIQVSIVKCIW